MIMTKKDIDNQFLNAKYLFFKYQIAKLIHNLHYIC